MLRVIHLVAEAHNRRYLHMDFAVLWPNYIGCGGPQLSWFAPLGLVIIALSAEGWGHTVKADIARHEICIFKFDVRYEEGFCCKTLLLILASRDSFDWG